VRKVIEAAYKNYKRYPNVCGISHGAKFSDGQRNSSIKNAVQFFVSKKIGNKEDLKKTLPGFVYGRNKQGKVDKSVKIPTDVIELQNLELCCLSGNEVSTSTGARGSINLIFENQVGDPSVLILTCSHVAGDMTFSPLADELRGGNMDCQFQANVIANTVVLDGEVEYDIAVAQPFNVFGTADQLTSTANVQFTGFGIAEDYKEGTVLECHSLMSEVHNIRIESEESFFENILTPEGNQVIVHNLLACTGIVERGDSGGIVYRDDRAVGIIVAKADDNWVFIHPLENAVNHLSDLSGLGIECF
jgi:hypothetical protein